MYISLICLDKSRQVAMSDSVLYNSRVGVECPLRPRDSSVVVKFCCV